MQLRQIEVFHAVTLTGSISSVARHLRLSQPAATTGRGSLALVRQGAGAAIVDQCTVATSNAMRVAVRLLSFDFTFCVDTIRLSGQPSSHLVDARSCVPRASAFNEVVS